MMWGWGYDSGAWFWMLPMMFVFWGVAIAGVVLLVRFLATPRLDGFAGLDAPRRRLDAGQITRDEYEHAKRILGW
ncbi:MAG: SHOCT domain-containing protein [Chloroflexi bacterium]|nr:MAG: SHOCT domain-containing protein [Chloroflexota bacterium]